MEAADRVWPPTVATGEVVITRVWGCPVRAVWGMAAARVATELLRTMLLLTVVMPWRDFL
jgi:hypothetical protein